jgi:hypothetical protein
LTTSTSTSTLGRSFSPFINEHIERAVALTDRLMAVADAGGDEEGLEAALQEVEEAFAREDADLVRHAFLMFITHHKLGSRLPLPGLEERHSRLFLPRPSRRPALAAEDEDPERVLDWYREDALANQHHEHWHVVYPTEGVPDGQGGSKVQDRQGELFFYMHRQMLARYDAERLAVGLPPTLPLTDYRAPIAEGYDPPGDVFTPRQPNATLSQVTMGDGRVYTVAEHEALRDSITSMVGNGAFGNGDVITADRLGSAVEPSLDSPLADGANLHGLGHVLIADIHDPDGTAGDGAMVDVRSAIMDPVFYRWHRHVDDLLTAWQDRQPPGDFGDGPSVAFPSHATGKSGDVLLVFRDAIAGADKDDFDPQIWGEQTFGGSQWERDFGGSELTTDTLETQMKSRASGALTLRYLDHRDFLYFFRVENAKPEPSTVTMRVFLAPTERADDRLAWIELDKFQATVPGDTRTVIARAATRSSVVQKPAVRPPQPRRSAGIDAAANYCTCGWPLHLLLPRGTPEGLSFRLLVMLTDWATDEVPHDMECGAMSFCGARDARYPDRRPMGYPFDRPFQSGRSLGEVLGSLSNVATRDISITYVT